jgi:hypothetical protein
VAAINVTRNVVKPSDIDNHCKEVKQFKITIMTLKTFIEPSISSILQRCISTLQDNEGSERFSDVRKLCDFELNYSQPNI